MSGTMFPRTEIGGLSVPRMIIGCNWFLGYTHQTEARSHMIRTTMTPEKIADIIEVYLEVGINAVISQGSDKKLQQTLDIVSQRTGKEMILISTPILECGDDAASYDENARLLDAEIGYGAKICMPHMVTTDKLVDPIGRRIRNMDKITKMIRERGMIPGLSTHRPDTPVIADESGLDVETYIQIYNAAGFLMHIEIDWVHRSIWQCKKPVLTIKAMAAGRLMPLVGLGFSWGTLRDCDMIAVGSQTPMEAAELIEISMSLLENRQSNVALQTTRSKQLMQRKGQ